jgi:DNA polymerase III sliding clamp (beta) subunit (PCNA family)
MSKLDKMKISMNENKTTGYDSLLFYTKDGLLNIYLSNGQSSVNFGMNISVDEDKCFAVDANLFYNAFSNFPTDEVQFAYLEDDHSLVFGNKKTRVSLRTSIVSNIDDLLFNSFDISSDVVFDNLNYSNFSDALRLTSFSCAPDIDEYPYTSILMFVDKNEFNCCSSDKHRISIFGKKYTNQSSHLIPKSSADLLLNFVNKNDEFKFTIYKSKLFLKWDDNIFTTALENNSYQSVFENYNKFFSESNHVLSTKVDKQQLLQSIKFIGNISSSHTINMHFEADKLIITGSSADKGTIVDKIQLEEEVESLEVVYLANHLLKVIEILPQDQITLNVKEYNGFYLLMVETLSYNHIVFPMG